MIVMKGVEIIPKRDKVTYATNVTGKWENYSIETREGTLVKFAFETAKKLIAEGNNEQLSKEISSLKDHLQGKATPEAAPVVKPQVVSLFDEPLLETAEKVKKSLPCEEFKKAVEEVKVTVIKEIAKDAEIPVTLVVESQDDKTTDRRKKYVVTAGKNKVERQLYLFVSEDDPDNWNIGIIPCPLPKYRCYELISKARKDLAEKAANSKIKNIKVDVPFMIEEWHPKTEATTEENIARGKQMLEELRKQREAK